VAFLELLLAQLKDVAPEIALAVDLDEWGAWHDQLQI
jgi:hypothetical protein